METTPLIDLESVAKHLKLPVESVQRTAELLEEGNTVPFITRFRKDQTGGLDEQQIRLIESELARAKLLAERKETVLKSIESRGKLTDKLAAAIKKARLLGDLEDIYLPYKPKKQSLASLARTRGLEPLATAVLEAKEATPTLEERAAAFVDEAKDVPNLETVLEGLKHLIAEHFGHHRQLRAQLRRHLSKNGRLVSKQIEQPEASKDEAATEAAPQDKPSASEEVKDESAPVAAESPSATGEPATPAEEAKATETPAAETVAADPAEASGDSTQAETTVVTVETAAKSESPATEVAVAEATAAEAAPAQDSTKDPVPADAQPSAEGDKPAEETKAAEASPPENEEAKADKKKDDAASRRDQRREMRRRRRERLVQSFKDYFDFSDPIGRVPHHRILAINRGERTKVLRVKIECPDWDKVQAETESTAIHAEHPYADFLRTCLQDAMQRLLQPSIEREVRRDLNDRAEEHAVTVFARNLRKLLLQPPLRQHRVVAIDPGFRSGCKIVAVDEFGQVLGHTFVNLLGKDQQKQSGREALANFVQEHKATVVAVGNGAACRETETLVAEVLSNELKDQQVGYLIVNEAGTSVYSTSELGREELPDVDATVRSAVSIGRRSLDPLSELVKIDPASIGVGLYQHDVKAKHLRESLDAVVESCVNYVGVDVNSASPALLRYVSGLNSLTARKIYEHRQKNGPFKSREQLRDVSGIGESTYVQAVGFLKIVHGDNPLDGTWIHPESYETATKVLGAIGSEVEDLRGGSKSGATKEQVPPSEQVGEPASEPATATETSVATEATPAPETSVTEAAPKTEAAADSTASAAEPVAPTTSDSAPASESPTEEAAKTDAAKTEAPNPDVVTAEPTPNEPDATAPVAAPAAVAASPTEAPPAIAPTVPAKPVESVSPKKELIEKLSKVDVAELAPKMGVGKLLLEDILKSLARPGRDPREDLPPPIFRTGILKLEDLKPEMELSGTVLNVVDFGAFVDIGLVDSGLIHVSRLADRYISDPHDVVSVGDILRVWVVEVDQKRRRVSLTAIEPGTEKPKPAKEQRRRKPRGEAGQGGSGKGEKSEGRQGGGRPSGGRSGRGGPKGKKFTRGKGHKSAPYKPKAPPKPVVPITEEMENGSEPMRTFGDLKQLFEKKKRPGSK